MSKIPGACPMCGESTASFICSRQNGSRIARCNKCNLHYMYPTYSDEEIEKIYASDTYFNSYDQNSLNAFENYIKYNENAKHDPTSHFYFRLKYLKQFVNPKSTLLEVGSACGDFLDFVQMNSGFEVLGLEINPKARGISLNRFPHIKIFDKPLEFMPQESLFDIICLFAVLEHIKEPNSFIESLKKHLKPKGIVYISVPNINTYYFLRKRWPDLSLSLEHVIFYSPRSLTTLMRNHGFALELMQTIKFDLPRQPAHWRIIYSILPIFGAGKEIDAIFRLTKNN